MKFGELMKVHKPDLVISKRYDAWVQRNSNPVYSEEALTFGREQLAAQASPRDRRGTVSASSSGKCMRRQQFTYLGMPEMAFSAKTSAILQNGTFMHIRWQMAGLTEGFLVEAEVPVPKNNSLRLSGTMDGIAYDGSIVEFKSANSGSFGRVVTFNEPLHGHDIQLGTYMMVTGAEKGCLVYENKDTQEYKEIVITADEVQTVMIERKLEAMWQQITIEQLAEPLSAAYENKAPCSTCPFRDNCLKAKSWDHAKEIAEEARR